MVVNLQAALLRRSASGNAELVVFFAHAGEEEDGVVDREPEGDREDAGGADGVDIAVAAERIAGGHLADQGDDADRGGDRGEVEGDAPARQGAAPGGSRAA